MISFTFISVNPCESDFSSSFRVNSAFKVPFFSRRSHLWLGELSPFTNHMEVSIGVLSHQGSSSHPVLIHGGSRLSRALGRLALLAEAIPSREGLSKSMLAMDGMGGSWGSRNWGLPDPNFVWFIDAWKIAENWRTGTPDWIAMALDGYTYNWEGPHCGYLWTWQMYCFPHVGVILHHLSSRVDGDDMTLQCCIFKGILRALSLGLCSY